MIKQDNLIKDKLLRLYKKNNPSLPTSLKERMKINQKALEKLSFPVRFFKNLSVGDFACGTGEFCMVAAKNGAKAEGFDFNEISVNIAKKNTKKLKIKNCKFHKKEFFKIKKKYDFVICTAALHHLPSPYEGLKYLKSRVKKNGFLFVSFGLDSSNIIHNLLKLIVRNWGKKDNDITKTSKFLFKNHIERCIKFGLRKEDSVIADQFINTQHHFLNLRNVLKILEKNFSLHSSWPPKYLPLADSLNNVTVKKHNFMSSELMWSTKTFDDDKRHKNFSTSINFKLFEKFKDLLNNNPNKSIDEILKKYNFLKLKKNFDYNKLDFSFNLSSHTNKFYHEIHELLLFFKKKRNLNEAKKEINKKKYIFKGTNGLGLNYFIFKKN